MSRIENFGFEVFNIACGDRFTINQLFTKLKASVSQYNPMAMDINVKHQEPRAGDILHSHANIDKAVEQLNYSVIVEPDEGIKKTVDWFMNHLSSLT
jgi:nucleoside-diphosphate-sugar epimerase